MINIDVIVDETGVLRSCKVTGHARAGKTGADIVCAAVSVLMRTGIRILAGRKGISVSSGAPKTGHWWLEIEYTAEGRDFLSAAGDFLITGLHSVAEDFPDNCRLKVSERRN